MKFFQIMGLVSSVLAATGPAWDYNTNNGEDWPNIVYTDGKTTNVCGGTNQSPIDLKNTWPTRSARYDNFNKLYTN